MEAVAYKIVLEKGKAKKPYYEMNEQEREEVSKRVCEDVKQRAAVVGSKPVTSNTILEK
jgi:hypothetical protein